MKLVVKPNTKNINDYINAGIDAFIFCLKNFSSFTTNPFNITEIKRIKKDYPGINVYIEIDKNIFNKDIEKLKDVLIAIDNLDISGILFYDLSVLSLKNKLNLHTNLIWAPNFLATNYKTINFYQSIGCAGARISPCITFKETLNILDNINMISFINIFGYQMMAFSKRKLVTNYFKFIKEEDNYSELIKDGKKYNIMENETGTLILSDTILNGIKYIKDLNNYDTNLILDEININHAKFLKVIKLYNKSIKEDVDLTENINKLFKNTSLGFFDKELIVKVKK